MNKRTLILIICLFLVLGAGGFWYWKKWQEQNSADNAKMNIPSGKRAPTTTTPQSEADATQGVIDYSKIEKDKDLKSLMEDRKGEYGVNKSVDMIVKPDESLAIGSNTIPMRDILDKIRFKKGVVAEKNLAGGAGQIRIDKDRLLSESRKAEDRFAELEKILANPDSVQDKNAYPKYAREYAQHQKTVRDIRNYQQIEKQIQDNDDLLKLTDADIKKKLLDDINTLHIEKDRIETTLKSRLMPDGTSKQLVAKLKKTEQRFQELEKLLSNPKIIQDTETYQKYFREYAELKDIVKDYRQYKEIQGDIADKKELLKQEGPNLKMKILEKATALNMQKAEIENELAIDTAPDKKVELYGIHVVQPGDNIWNIHFHFLKEYFASKGVTVSRRADQPEHGKSSGVGKILKFSENMVSIYNLNDRNLSVDLNVINPFSKVVVFNLAQAFSLLEQIDYKNIKHIRFDGERIWIPAEQ